MLKPLIPFLLSIVFFSFYAQGQFTFRPSHLGISSHGQDLSYSSAGGLNSGQFGKLDLNNDGIEDLVIFDRSSNRFMTFLAIDSKWSYSPEYEYLFPENIQNWVVFADYDCDGKKDIFTYAPAGMKVYRNTSSGNQISFTETVPLLLTQGFSGQVNLAINQTDVPAIVDLDGDGDLDILVFNFAQGDYIEYHKNMSIEENGNCSELKFVRSRDPWGDFWECFCDIFGFGERCEVPDWARTLSKNPEKDQSILHASGKALLAIDFNGNGVKDLILGMEDCEELYILKNHGTKDDALIRSFSNVFPDSANPAIFHIFPAAYHEDLDFDGKKDLIVAPNFPLNPTGQIDFTKASWFFKNTGSETEPDFTFQTNTFLQSEMLDVGANAAPFYIDIDDDGDLDLIIGHRGMNNGESYSSSLFLFENTGTRSEPYFELRSTDLYSLSSLGLYNLKPQFADINNDGLPDLFFSASQYHLFNQTKVYYLLNKGGFSFDINELKELPVTFGMHDNFLVYDVDEDGRLDFLHARVTGKVDFFKNTGTENSPDFSMEKEAFLGMDNNFFQSNPSLAIADLNNDGNPELVVADCSGVIKIYKDFQEYVHNPAPMPIIDVVNTSVAGSGLPSRIGSTALIAMADLHNEGAASLTVGSPQGGLLFYKNTSLVEGNNDFKVQIEVYPNPARNFFKLKANTNVQIEVYSILGQKVYSIPSLERGYEYEVPTDGLSNGIYIVKASAQGKSSNKKIVVYK